MNRNDSIHTLGGRQSNGTPAEELEEGEVQTETEDQLPASPVSISFLFPQLSNCFHFFDQRASHTIQIISLAHSPHVNHLDERNATDQPSVVCDMPQMGFSSGQASAQGSCKLLS